MPPAYAKQGVRRRPQSVAVRGDGSCRLERRSDSHFLGFMSLVAGIFTYPKYLLCSLANLEAANCAPGSPWPSGKLGCDAPIASFEYISAHVGVMAAIHPSACAQMTVHKLVGEASVIRPCLNTVQFVDTGVRASAQAKACASICLCLSMQP